VTHGNICLPDEESLAWIPGRLMLEASRDPAFGFTLLDGPLKNGIFPAKLSDAAAAHHWVAIFQVHCIDPHLVAGLPYTGSFCAPLHVAFA
jgi:hypothetical protein